MRQMGGNTVYKTRHSTLIQMGSNESRLNSEFAHSTQFGANDDSPAQACVYPEQQQKPYTDYDRLRDAQARQMGSDLSY